MVQPIFKAGQVIACPSCGVYIAECIVDQYPGMLITRASFKPLDGHPIGDPSGRMVCGNCGEWYARRDRAGKLQVHTPHGWLPDVHVG